MLRTAAVGGAAYHMGKRRAQRDDVQAAETAAPPPPPAAPAGAGEEDAMAKLKQLGELHEQGVLTDQEFEEQKQRYLQAL